MLVLSRKVGERIFIASGIEVAVVDVRGGKVRIGIEAPDHIRIRRVDARNDSAFSSQSSMPGAKSSS
ncbi:MAG TPA: carbon storage regulator [Planctomycetaceae bacterium]|nr:carbon storage regulator [Planctomycetaceae bacterium]